MTNPQSTWLAIAVNSQVRAVAGRVELEGFDVKLLDGTMIDLRFGLDLVSHGFVYGRVYLNMWFGWLELALLNSLSHKTLGPAQHFREQDSRCKLFPSNATSRSSNLPFPFEVLQASEWNKAHEPLSKQHARTSTLHVCIVHVYWTSHRAFRPFIYTCNIDW